MKNFTLKVLGLALFAFMFGNSNGQDMVDLTGIDNANILNDTLPDLMDGSIVVLDANMTYNAGYAFDKSVTLKSNDPTGMMMPVVDCADNFNFADGATIDSIVFMNLNIKGDFDGNYVLNSNVSATIGKLKFDGCHIHSLRGVLRMKDAGPGSLGTYAIMNSVVDSIRDYGVLTVDVTDWMVNNITFMNSTFYKTRTFITSKNNTDMVVIDGCTINEVTTAGQRMFRWREAGQDNVTGGIMIKNTIWGAGWDEDNTGSSAIDGFDGLGETTWTVENTYATNELSFADGKDTIFALLDMVYDGSASDLWVEPYAGNFNYYDMTFEGIGMAGDPRWAKTTEDATGLEWNISDTAFSALGEVDMTKTVAGLTIYAHSGKTVTVDENGKTLDDMTFTHRLKLGGSGDFDDMGQPLGRVLSIDVMGNTNIMVAAMSSSSDENRVLNIGAGSMDNVIAEFPAMGESLTGATYYYSGGPTKLYFWSPSSGVNVYYLKATSVPTSVKEFDVAKSVVNIYPNPASDRVYVDYNKPIRVGVYNIAGSLLKSKLIRSNYDYISVGDLQPGVYLIRSLNDDAFARKLIKR